MRLIHTSDWHLGQTLHGQDRDYEHAQFLAWLLDQLIAQQPDALLIAGDIFDTVNPPLKAQERLYDFIVRSHEKLPQLDSVIIAGNHDSHDCDLNTVDRQILDDKALPSREELSSPCVSSTQDLSLEP